MTDRDDEDGSEPETPPRDPSGRFVSPPSSEDADGGDVDGTDETGEIDEGTADQERDDEATASTARRDGGSAEHRDPRQPDAGRGRGYPEPPNRQLAEREIRAWLTEVLETLNEADPAAAREAVDSFSPDARRVTTDERAGATRDAARSDEVGGDGEAFSVIRDDDETAALDEAGYTASAASPSLGEPPRSVQTESYQVVNIVPTDVDDEDGPARSVSEVLADYREHVDGAGVWTDVVDDEDGR